MPLAASHELTPPLARQGRRRPPPRAPSYGVLSSVAKDQVYWFGSRGFIFTSPWVVTPATVRHAAVVLLTASGRSFELSVRGEPSRYQAVAIAPHTPRGLRAVDVGLVSLHVEPHHPCYRAFGAIAAPGVQRLDRAAFRPFDDALQRAYEGRLTLREADPLFDALVATAVTRLPAAARRDERAALLRGFVRAHPTCSLGDVARELDVSYARASRLFSHAVGMPLRAYQHWLKCMRAEERFGARLPWTRIAHEAGFADSSHLARSWQRSYGHPPSYIRDARHVRVVR